MADLAFIGQGSPFLKRSQEMEDMRFLFSSPGEGGSKFFLCNYCFEGLYAKSGSFHRGHEAWQPRPAPGEGSVG